MADNKKVIRKTNLDGKLVTVPIKTVSVIPTQVSLSDNLNLGDNIIFAQLTRLMAITKERIFTPDEAYMFDVFMKNMLQILKIKKLELKDLDIENMPSEELMKYAERYIAKGMS